MKKVRLIVVVAIAALMIMGIGYAAWANKKVDIYAGGSFHDFGVGITAASADKVAVVVTPNPAESVTLASTHLLAPANPYSVDFCEYQITITNTGKDSNIQLASLKIAGKNGVEDHLAATVTFTYPDGSQVSKKVEGLTASDITFETADTGSVWGTTYSNKTPLIGAGQSVTVGINVQMIDTTAEDMMGKAFALTFTPGFQFKD